MKSTERRRFGLGDGLIVIAGIAGGMGLFRFLLPDASIEDILAEFATPQGGWNATWIAEMVLSAGSLLALPAAIAWSPACLLFQALKPRPPRRRLARRPGFVACLVVVSISLAVALIWPACLSFPIFRGRSREMNMVKPVLLIGLLGGTGVVVAWATMVLTRAWRPAPTWTDRLGRLTGAAWVVLGLLSGAYLMMAIR